MASRWVTPDFGPPSSASTSSGLTVVIPVWDDYVRFLPEAVGSVRREAPGAPIVVVDNVSTTSVPRLSGTSVLRAPRRLSAGGARNVGLEQVDTEYVLFLDADDLFLEGALGFMASRIAGDSSLAVCATSVVDSETGERHRTPRRFVHSLSRWRRTFAVADCIWSLYPIQGCAVMRTAQVREAGAYADANWGEDWPLAVSLAFRGRVEVDRRPGRFYRATRGSLWRRPRRARELVGSARLVRERLRSDPAVPAWARALLPVIFGLQIAAVYAVRPAYLAARRLTRQLSSRRSSAPRENLDST